MAVDSAADITDRASRPGFVSNRIAPTVVEHFSARQMPRASSRKRDGASESGIDSCDSDHGDGDEAIDRAVSDDNGSVAHGSGERALIEDPQSSLGLDATSSSSSHARDLDSSDSSEQTLESTCEIPTARMQASGSSALGRLWGLMETGK
ncbi:hypothetical protein BDV96DRAFT_644774 [Lophiotrema nucula]|uniref:Uncharacterized protein n=1 Tax=Lophiotrema nucula TaxID=690887 RepID=A0A6A5ZCW5_9PLEO|nr:hypothetical protein BDV96DRAFT_644774 [Lophiotrema nucula]